MEDVLIHNANVLQIADPSGDAGGIMEHGIQAFSEQDLLFEAQNFDFAESLTP